MDYTNLPLPLDNTFLSNVLGVGPFKCEYLSFEETKGIIESYAPRTW